jgi:hypothetical protein
MLSATSGKAVSREPLTDLETFLKRCKIWLRESRSAILKSFIEELKIFDKMLEEFKNPVSMVYNIGSNILVNGVNIWHEIQAARNAYLS